MSEFLSPHMDPEGLHCFQEHLSRSRCYLEYGMGGSTVYAARTASVPCIISVENDKAWIDKVASQIPEGSANLEFCDLGPVREWGVPKGQDRICDFWQYPSAPWRKAKELSVSPDTVLIDGRFRVASFLFSLVNAADGATILFDDYMDRANYHLVEKFCKRASNAGRMGIFSVTSHYPFAGLAEAIARYSVLPDD